MNIKEMQKQLEANINACTLAILKIDRDLNDIKRDKAILIGKREAYNDMKRELSTPRTKK